MTFAQRQRSAIIDLMAELGPFAPTKCGDWQTQDLAAHLYVREHRPDALAGIGFSRFESRTERIQREELHSRGFLGLLEELRSTGWIMRPLDKLVNTSEMFIHHEDVLRANDRSQSLTAEEEKELWPVAKMMARRAHTGFGGRLVLRRTDTGEETQMGRGDRPVTVSGTPGELLLHLSGREADVRIDGEPDAIEAWKESIGGL